MLRCAAAVFLCLVVGSFALNIDQEALSWQLPRTDSFNVLPAPSSLTWTRNQAVISLPPLLNEASLGSYRNVSDLAERITLNFLQRLALFSNESLYVNRFPLPLEMNWLETRYDSWDLVVHMDGNVSALHPQVFDDESYDLSVMESKNGGLACHIEAHTHWGVVRAFSTLLQLVSAMSASE